MNNLGFDLKTELSEYELNEEIKSGVHEEKKRKDEKEKNAKNSMVLLEEALSTCKFGKFHIRLLITTLCSTFATTMVTTTSAYILPSAECDLAMTSVQKGILNAVPFFGQVGAAMFTGFCIDAFGRKMFLVGGNLGILICSLFESLSQNYWMLLMGKLIEGIFLSFSTSGVSTMVSEMTPVHLRNRMLLILASFMSVSLIVTALMSWAILPQPWTFIISPYFTIHSWNIYLIVCSVWSLLACIMFYNLPESPKWYLTHGQEDEALEVLRDIYVENTGNTPESFPHETLKIPGAAPSVSSKDISLKRQIINGLKDSKDLFKPPLVWPLAIFSSIVFVCLFAYSALRLWYPQLSTMIESYIDSHHGPADFCTMLTNYNVVPEVTALSNHSTIESVLVRNITEPEVCIPHLSGTQTYVNNIIMGAISLVCFLISMYLVEFTGQKVLIFISCLLCAASSGALYWSTSSLQVALLVSFACAFVQNSIMLQQVMLVHVFPTVLRSLAFSVVLMCGRIGSLVGNIMFPILLEAGCMAPFLLLASITTVIACIVYFLPGEKKGAEGSNN